MKSEKYSQQMRVVKAFATRKARSHAKQQQP